jgi:hypothetical protein
VTAGAPLPGVEPRSDASLGVVDREPVEEAVVRELTSPVAENSRHVSPAPTSSVRTTRRRLVTA